MGDICVKEKDDLWNYSFTRDLRFDSIGAGVDDAFMLCILRKKLSFRASDFSCTLY